MDYFHVKYSKFKHIFSIIYVYNYLIRNIPKLYLNNTCNILNYILAVARCFAPGWCNIVEVNYKYKNIPKISSET